MTELRIQTHFLSFVLYLVVYIRLNTKFYHTPSTFSEKRISKIKGKCISFHTKLNKRKIKIPKTSLLFPMIIIQNTVSAMCVCVLWSVITNQFNGIDNNVYIILQNVYDKLHRYELKSHEKYKFYSEKIGIYEIFPHSIVTNSIN